MKRIAIVGSPNFEWIKQSLESKKDLIEINTTDNKKLILDRKSYNLLVYHPSMYDELDYTKAISKIIDAYKQLTNERLIIIPPNLDKDAMKHLSLKTSTDEQMTLSKACSQGNYARIVEGANLVIGNSSSLIREAPFIGTKSVIIGERQRGRKRPGSVKQCRLDRNEMITTIGESLKEKFNGKNRYMYGDGETSKKAAEFIVDNYDIEIQK